MPAQQDHLLFKSSLKGQEEDTSSVVLGNGFKSFSADQCVYVKRLKIGFFYVYLYDRAMTVAAKTSEEIQDVQKALRMLLEVGARTGKVHPGMAFDHDMTVEILMIRHGTRTTW